MPWKPTNIHHNVLYKEITLKKQFQYKIWSKYSQSRIKLHIFSKFSPGVPWPLACVQLISSFLYEKNQFFSFRMQSKYTLKRINYDMFSKKNSESYNYNLIANE